MDSCRQPCSRRSILGLPILVVESTTLVQSHFPRNLSVSVRKQSLAALPQFHAREVGEQGILGPLDEVLVDGECRRFVAAEGEAKPCGGLRRMPRLSG
jgi:hypothetical protein